MSKNEQIVTEPISIGEALFNTHVGDILNWLQPSEGGRGKVLSRVLYYNTETQEATIGHEIEDNDTKKKKKFENTFQLLPMRENFYFSLVVNDSFQEIDRSKRFKVLSKEVIIDVKADSATAALALENLG